MALKKPSTVSAYKKKKCLVKSEKDKWNQEKTLCCLRIGSRSISVRSPLVSRSFFASPSLHPRFLLASEAESNEEVTEPEQMKLQVVAGFDIGWMVYGIEVRGPVVQLLGKEKITKKANYSQIKYLALYSVGVAGFEPTTPCSQSRCANRTALHPECKSFPQMRCKDSHFFLICQVNEEFSNFCD